MEHLKEIKRKLVECAYEEIKHNWDYIDICELEKVIDMIKDLEKSLYYASIVKAMEEEDSEKYIKWVHDEEPLDHKEMHKKDHSE